MSVRAVTPRLLAISGHLQFAHTNCGGDCCNFDADQDDRAVGDPYDPEWPDKPLRLSPHQAKQRTAGADASSARLIHGSGDREGGRYARTPEPQSSTSVGARGGAGESTAAPGSGRDDSTTGPCAGSEPSPPGVSAGTGTLSPDRGQHTPGSDLAACEVALSGAPETLMTTHSGASNTSDEQSRPGWSPDGS